MSRLTQGLSAGAIRHLGGRKARSLLAHLRGVGLREDTDRVLALLGVHQDRYREALGATDLSPFEYRVFSQNGEDGVIGEILRRLRVASRSFVEFGIGSGHQGNCVALADLHGWSGLFIESDDGAYRRLANKYRAIDRVRTLHATVTPTNIESLLAGAGVIEEPDVLSIDIDGADYWVWEAIVSFRPRLVVIEYNANLDPDRALVRPLAGRAWDGTDWFGASIGALRRLAAKKGYQLVHTDLCGINAFFVREDLSATVGVPDPPVRTANYGLVGGSLRRDPESRPWIDLDLG